MTMEIRRQLRILRGENRHQPVKWWRVAGGVVLLVLGLAGLMLPVLQGGLLLLLALLVLSADIRLVRYGRLRMERRLPRLRRAIRRTREWWHRKFHKDSHDAGLNRQ